MLIREGSLAEVLQVNSLIPKFAVYTPESFAERLAGKTSVILVAEENNQPIGYMIGYDRDRDGSLYCWLTAVSPDHQRQGILKQLIAAHDEWAKEHGYQKIKIKTHNDNREMLSFMVKYGYDFVHVEPKENVADNEVMAEKQL
jgi:GNAT superfamily N-acetyltransferase